MNSSLLRIPCVVDQSRRAISSQTILGDQNLHFKESNRLGGDILTVDDLPVPAKRLKYIFNLVFPGKQAHLRAEETVLSTGRLFRVPISRPATIVVTADPDHAATMFRNEGELPVRPGASPLAGFMEKHGFGKGLVLSDLEEWHTLRSKSNKQVIPRKVLEFTPLIHEVAGDVVQYFRAHRRVNNYVDSILEPVMDWAFEAIGIYILGERLNIFTTPNTKMRAFQQAAIQYIDGLTPLLTILPLYKLIPTPSSIRFVNAVQELEEITQNIVEEKSTRLRSKLNKDAVGFLDQWILNDSFSNDDIFVLVRDFLAAGIDTTSLAGTYMLFELAKNPHVQEKLREEVLSVVGEHGVPTVQDLQKLPYAKNIITETLRRYPIITTNRRVLVEDVIMDSYIIPKGTWIITDNYSMSRDPTIFEEPLTFNPDRWTRESKKKNAFAHLPFGFGPRACYGRRLSEAELTVLLIQITRNFHLETDMSHVESAGTTVLKPTTPVRIQFNDRVVK